VPIENVVVIGGSGINQDAGLVLNPGEFTVVPEPGTYALLGSFIAAGACMRRRAKAVTE